MDQIITSKYGMHSYEEALRYCLRTLQIREKLFGEDNLIVARSLNILSKIYQA